jgi:hypothetical protein
MMHGASMARSRPHTPETLLLHHAEPAGAENALAGEGPVNLHACNAARPSERTRSLQSAPASVKRNESMVASESEEAAGAQRPCPGEVDFNMPDRAAADRAGPSAGAQRSGADQPNTHHGRRKSAVSFVAEQAAPPQAAAEAQPAGRSSVGVHPRRSRSIHGRALQDSFSEAEARRQSSVCSASSLSPDAPADTSSAEPSAEALAAALSAAGSSRVPSAPCTSRQTSARAYRTHAASLRGTSSGRVALQGSASATSEASPRLWVVATEEDRVMWEQNHRTALLDTVGEGAQAPSDGVEAAHDASSAMDVRAAADEMQAKLAEALQGRSRRAPESRAWHLTSGGAR